MLTEAEFPFYLLFNSSVVANDCTFFSESACLVLLLGFLFWTPANHPVFLGNAYFHVSLLSTSRLGPSFSLSGHWATDLTSVSFAMRLAERISRRGHGGRPKRGKPISAIGKRQCVANVL